MLTKVCPHCKRNKPIGAFQLRTCGRPYSWCKRCSCLQNLKRAKMHSNTPKTAHVTLPTIPFKA